jgi:hypothetical protein
MDQARGSNDLTGGSDCAQARGDVERRATEAILNCHRLAGIEADADA